MFIRIFSVVHLASLNSVTVLRKLVAGSFVIQNKIILYARLAFAAVIIMSHFSPTVAELYICNSLNIVILPEFHFIKEIPLYYNYSFLGKNKNKTTERNVPVF